MASMCQKPTDVEWCGLSPKGGSPCEELLKHAKAIATGKASPDTTKASTCELLVALVIEVMLGATKAKKKVKRKAAKKRARKK
ncbi:hypothetical protein LCGC14_0663250 [marine sediment metagenome]|uniref:Uncharacterized protein n=1 Tax=marine sediment metagenome TaxID=412755 RepID=A0A0F9RD42_9ZZZZ